MDEVKKYGKGFLGVCLVAVLVATALWGAFEFTWWATVKVLFWLGLLAVAWQPEKFRGPLVTLVVIMLAWSLVTHPDRRQIFEGWRTNAASLYQDVSVVSEPLPKKVVVKKFGPNEEVRTDCFPANNQKYRVSTSAPLKIIAAKGGELVIKDVRTLYGSGKGELTFDAGPQGGECKIELF